LAEACLLLPPPSSWLRRWNLSKHSKDGSDSGNKTKWMETCYMKTKPKRRQSVQIMTCCEEAKLTVLGTSYAI
jgi:hypothetical protein